MEDDEKKGGLVLIETLWNVKRKGKSFLVVRSGINRNIVECKAKKQGGVFVAVFSINRNIVECKVRKTKTASWGWRY